MILLREIVFKNESGHQDGRAHRKKTTLRAIQCNIMCPSSYWMTLSFLVIFITTSKCLSALESTCSSLLLNAQDHQFFHVNSSLQSYCAVVLQLQQQEKIFHRKIAPPSFPPPQFINVCIADLKHKPKTNISTALIHVFLLNLAHLETALEKMLQYVFLFVAFFLSR